MTGFIQEGPQLRNQFLTDQVLQDWLKAFVPADILEKQLPRLQQIGNDVTGDLFVFARQAEVQIPYLVSHSPWGKKIDEIITSEAWKKIESYASLTGIVPCGYDPNLGSFARLIQSSILYLFHSSSAFVSCPLAMTDGAVKALNLFAKPELKNRIIPHLLSVEPKNFWTSGQWMTERRGGSDVSQTETQAKKTEGDLYALFGTKWFTSATTSQVALTLARIEGAPSGSKGLSMFLIETRNANNELNKIKILRLKDKLGTKALPTAELELDGTAAHLLGEPGRGVKQITSMINITRLYNSVCAVSHARRALVLALDYSKRREAFGKLISEQPLHQQTLNDLTNRWIGSLYLTLEVARLLGKEENGQCSPFEQSLLRLLIPLTKLFTAKQCMTICSEVVEIFGGAGYVEDTGIPTLLRDAQVFSIWEGTTNILSLDLGRVFQKECPPDLVIEWFKKELEASPNNQFKVALNELSQPLLSSLKTLTQSSPLIAEGALRILAFQLSRFAICLLLNRHLNLQPTEVVKKSLGAWIRETKYELQYNPFEKFEAIQSQFV